MTFNGLWVIPNNIAVPGALAGSKVIEICGLKGQMKKYPSQGDGGHAELPDGTWTSKEDAYFHAGGAVDELNSITGWVESACLEGFGEFREAIALIQRELFEFGAALWSGPKDLDQFRVAVERMEGDISRWLSGLGPLAHFVLPGGCELACRLHVARTVCRRAERRVVALRRDNVDRVPTEMIRYLNRLSDWFFAAARWSNRRAGAQEGLWP